MRKSAQQLQQQHSPSSSSTSCSSTWLPTMRGLFVGFAIGLVTAHMEYLNPSSADKCASAWTSPQEILQLQQQEQAEKQSKNYAYPSSPEDIEKGLILPFERTDSRNYLPNKSTDSYTYFHHYLNKLALVQPTSPKDFTTLPQLHIWPRYFEAYHNHWQRFRGRPQVVFMEIGVQSGGKIPLLREYFGDGFIYIGIDINPSTKMFESADWIHIEIGDSGDRTFLESIKQKYPKVDLFLDDGGHAMNQQRLSLEVLLPHLQSDGVFMCEDLSTSWSPGSMDMKFDGIPYGTIADAKFRDTTTMGLVHRTVDWLNAGWLYGGNTLKYDPQLNNRDEYWKDTPWWKTFHSKVKHIHVYNQLVVYELGYVEEPYPTKTVGHRIDYFPSGEHAKVIWEPILQRVKNIITTTTTTTTTSSS